MDASWIKRIALVVLAFVIVLSGLYFFPLGKTVKVETQYGVLLGKQRNHVKAFLGVPFAKPPVGELRWKAPQPFSSWEELGQTNELRAFKKSPACLQGAVPNPALLTGESEDCLYLNIWVPEGEGPFPVMLWLHGGGFLLGSGSEPAYDGRYLAKHHQVAVVTANYRLGYQGYLRLPVLESEQLEGNQAYYDQIAALQWLKDNAEVFNMDANNLTVFGESAGSISSCLLLASPLTDGLVSKAILQSGSCELKKHFSVEEAEQKGLAFLEKIGCSDSDTPLTCARNLSHEQIYAALGVKPNEMFQKGFDEWSYTPAVVYGTDFMPEKALQALQNSRKQQVALMIGVTSDEGTLFDGLNPHAQVGDDWVTFLNGEKRFPGLGEQVAELYPWDETTASGEVTAQILTDAVMTCPSLKVANIWSQKNATYFYYFNQEVTAPIFDLMALQWTEGAAELGVAHSTEIPYILGNNGVLGYVLSSQQKQIRKLMSKAWADFAKTGNPASQQVDWPAYDSQQVRYIEFTKGTALEMSELRKEFCEFWFEHPVMGF